MSEECDGRSNLLDSAVPTNAGQLLHDLRVRTVLRAQFSVNRARLHAIERNSGSPRLSRESACEAVDGKFGCDIQRHAGKRCSLSEAGTDVDNPPPLLRNHPTSRVLRQRDDRPNVEVEMLVIGIFRTLHERPEDHRSCIVYEDVETPTEGATKSLVDGRDQLVCALNGAEISAHGLCFPARIADFLDDLFCTRRTCRIVDNDGSALGGQTDSVVSSDSARRSCDECKFVLQWFRHVQSPIWISEHSKKTVHRSDYNEMSVVSARDRPNAVRLLDKIESRPLRFIASFNRTDSAIRSPCGAVTRAHAFVVV